MLMACAVQKAAASTAGKEAVAMEGYARALMQLPTIMSDNAGFDPVDLVAQLRAAYVEGKNSSGINMETGQIADMAKQGVVESFRVKYAMLNSATEAAEMILRVDNIIKSAPRVRAPDHRHH